MKKFLLLPLFVFIFIMQVAAQTPDPGLTGSYAVTTTNYDYGDLNFTTTDFPNGIEVRAKVFYPTSLSPGPFPLIIILHGRHESCYNTTTNVTNATWPCAAGQKEIPSYQGYDYLAQKLASQGYIVVSIGANSISATDNNVSDWGMLARAQLIQHHLDLWNTFNTTGGSPFGTTFVGKVDLTRVGTMGHSRGGEGVVRHALYNKAQGNPYGIKAVMAVAPVDFNRPVLNNIPIAVVVPYCDGDVSALEGVHYYDDARYPDPNDNTPKHTMLMMGANHNYFNTVWTPGQFVAGTSDDWADLSTNSKNDPYCGAAASANKRFTDAKQRAALLTYACAFFRVYVGGEKQFAPILEVDDKIPPASSTLTAPEIHISYHPSSLNRLDINRTNNQGVKVTNTVSDSAYQNGLANYTICGDITANQFCLGLGQAQEPHNAYDKTAQVGLSQLELGWNNTTDWYENKLPLKYRNLSQYRALQFRAAVNFKDGPANQAMDFSIQLRTTNGSSQTIKVSDYTNALYFPQGTLTNYLPRILHNTIKIPLSKFDSINLSDVEYIRFKFNKNATGAIIISDLILSSDSTVKIAPAINFAANVTSTCDGKVSFTDNSVNHPTQWRWDFGDGTISTNQNVVHTFSANGTYTVKLVASNATGKDSLIKTAYIVVNKPAAPTVANGSRCGAGIVNLGATGSGSGSLTWYDSLSGGNKVNTGGTYSPTINGPTTFYVQEEIPGSIVYGGKTDNTGGGGYLNSKNGLFFNVLKSCTLVSVRVYAQTAGNRTIELRDAANTLLQTKTVNIPTGTQTVVLNFPLVPGNNYLLQPTGTINLYRNNVGVAYPYNVSNLISITTSTAATTPGNYYYFFYNWEVQDALCISSRVAVTGVIDVCTGISGNSSEGYPNVYPNPAKNALVIEKNGGAEKTLLIEFVNILGEKVFATTAENNGGAFKKTLDIENIPAGIYFVYIHAGENHWVYKLAKQ
jgi:PKD repeat protein